MNVGKKCAHSHDCRRWPCSCCATLQDCHKTVVKFTKRSCGHLTTHEKFARWLHGCLKPVSHQPCGSRIPIYDHFSLKNRWFLCGSLKIFVPIRRVARLAQCRNKISSFSFFLAIFWAIFGLRQLSINSWICLTKTATVARTPCNSLVFCRKAAAKRTAIAEARCAAAV